MATHETRQKRHNKPHVFKKDFFVDGTNVTDALTSVVRGGRYVVVRTKEMNPSPPKRKRILDSINLKHPQMGPLDQDASSKDDHVRYSMVNYMNPTTHRWPVRQGEINVDTVPFSWEEDETDMQTFESEDSLMARVPLNLLNKCWSRAVHAADRVLPTNALQHDPIVSTVSPLNLAIQHCQKWGIPRRKFEKRIDKIGDDISTRYVCPSCSHGFLTIQALRHHFLEGDATSLRLAGCCWALIQSKTAQSIENSMHAEIETCVDGLLHHLLSGVKSLESTESFTWKNVLNTLEDLAARGDIDVFNETTILRIKERLVDRYERTVLPQQGQTSVEENDQDSSTTIDINLASPRQKLGSSSSLANDDLLSLGDDTCTSTLDIDVVEV